MGLSLPSKYRIVFTQFKPPRLAYQSKGAVNTLARFRILRYLINKYQHPSDKHKNNFFQLVC